MEFTRNFIFISFILIFLGCKSDDKTTSDNTILNNSSEELNFKDLMKPIPPTAVLSDSAYFTWGGSMVEGEDGRFHLFYSRWPRELGFNAWVTHSEIAHAISEHPEGPYKFESIALPKRGGDFWDGSDTHNPSVHRFGDKYYLYYMGNKGDGKVMKGLNFSHRNNQRIGVAVADSLNGKWKRFDSPLIDVSPEDDAPDALMVANPSITQTPDGNYLMVYKAVGKKIKGVFGGPVVHCVATSSSPTGPFKKYPKTIFNSEGTDFPAEDPFIWFQEDRYWAILKDMHGAFTTAGQSLILFNSSDGFEWQLAKYPLVSKLQLKWKDSLQVVNRLERPQLWLKDGEPSVLFLAVQTQSDHSFNVHIPLKTKEEE
jgi:hypothetical protein